MFYFPNGETQRLAVWSAHVALAEISYLINDRSGIRKSVSFLIHAFSPMCHLEMHYIVGICAVASSVLGMEAVTVDTCPPHTVIF